MKDVMFLGISFQETKCSWEWVHTSNLKYKTTELSCTNKNVLEEEKLDQYFQKNLSAIIAARQQNFVPGGCRTPPGARGCRGRCGRIPPRDCGELPGAAARHSVKNLAAFPWLLHSSKSWGERFRSTVRSQIFLMCAHTSATERVWFFSFLPPLVFAALASQPCSLSSGEGRSNTSVLQPKVKFLATWKAGLLGISKER